MASTLRAVSLATSPICIAVCPKFEGILEAYTLDNTPESSASCEITIVSGPPPTTWLRNGMEQPTVVAWRCADPIDEGLLRELVWTRRTRGASSPRKGPCPPLQRNLKVRTFFQPDSGGLQACDERRFVCFPTHKTLCRCRQHQTLSNTRNSPKT